MIARPGIKVSWGKVYSRELGFYETRLIDAIADAITDRNDSVKSAIQAT